MLTVAKRCNFAELPDNGGVVVISVCLQYSDDAMNEMGTCISQEEHARAARYRFDKDRRAFIASHAVLRICLAHYVGNDPRAIVFAYSSEGKPQLDPSQHASEIQFNLSHAEGLVAVAITRKRRVGIDVEEVARVVDEIQIAEKYFSSTESASLHALPEADRRKAFLKYWTHKEAYAKATGRGLSDVLERAHKEQFNDPNFTFLPLALGDGYVGVVAVEGEAELAQHLQFTSLDDFLAQK